MIYLLELASDMYRFSLSRSLSQIMVSCGKHVLLETIRLRSGRTTRTTIPGQNGARQRTKQTVNMENRFQSLIGMSLAVPCSTWKDIEVAEMLFGEECDVATTTTPAKVSKVYFARNGRPLFQCFFPAIDQTFKSLELDYVLRYAVEVPDTFHDLRASILKTKEQAPCISKRSVAAVSAPARACKALKKICVMP